MFEYLTLLRIVFSLSFGFIFLYITRFITKVEKSKCPLSNSLYISNGKLLSSLLMLFGFINTFIPINKIIYNIPVIGSSYVLIFVSILFGILFIIKRIADNLNADENKKCKKKEYKFLIDFVNNRSINECFIFTIITSIVFFYL
jgi:carbon starvation protein CstA